MGKGGDETNFSSREAARTPGLEKSAEPRSPAHHQTRSIVVSTWYLLTSRQRFLERAQEHNVAMAADSGKRTAPTHDPPYYETQTDRVRASLGRSVLLVIAVVLAGAVAGSTLHRCVGPPSQDWSQGLLYAGTGLLLWATLAKGGWSIQSFKGTTLAEIVDEFIFRALHLLGTFLVVLSATWTAAYFS